MSGQAVGRGRRVFLATGILVLALALLGAAPPADWDAVWEVCKALPWGGPAWWLLRAALVLMGGVF